MLAEGLKSGKNYKQTKSVLILIANFALRKDKTEYLSHVNMRYEDNNEEFSDIIKIIVLELSKIPKTPDKSKIWYWLKFLASRSEEEMAMCAKSVKEIKGAIESVKYMSHDESMRIHWLGEEKVRRDHDVAIYNALIEGRSEGLAEGKAEGLAEGEKRKAIETARNFLRMGLTAEQIALGTGLSIEEVEKLM
jgi:predicted transposase/invertase (TIGR01784 family)